jgi:hypothetical protein
MMLMAMVTVTGMMRLNSVNRMDTLDMMALLMMVGWAAAHIGQVMALVRHVIGLLDSTMHGLPSLQHLHRSLHYHMVDIDETDVDVDHVHQCLYLTVLMHDLIPH